MLHTLLLYLLRFLFLYIGLLSSLLPLSYVAHLPTAFYARSLLSNILLLTCAFFGLLASGPLTLTRYGRRSTQWLAGRAFKHAMYLSTGAHFDIVEGKQHLSNRPAVFIANHQTELDVLLLGTIFPPFCSVTAKKSLSYMPFLGWFMSLSGTVFIDRANRSLALKAFDGAAAEMQREQQSVFIFPEGTRNNAQGPELGAFKKGAFHLAVKAEVDIVPIVSACYAGVLSVKETRFTGGSIPVKVLPPISTKGLTSTDVEDLTRTTRDLMLKELIALSESPIGQKVATTTSTNGSVQVADGLATGNVSDSARARRKE